MSKREPKPWTDAVCDGCLEDCKVDESYIRRDKAGYPLLVICAGCIEPIVEQFNARRAGAVEAASG